eukprot:TRINITY_DN11900_c0_g1_i1.p1 TRINITY_DN11900_c0_g1~~TRINITY_DN11900_c0_g1_i1.p1  ORF type:complete len:314 (+),score=89.23 TRINITY_DN11900_c0_g1_i1:56-997(+)
MSEEKDQTEDSTKTTCLFKKNVGKKNTLRKRKQDDFALEDESSTVLVEKKKEEGKNIFVAKKEQKKMEEDIYVSTKSSELEYGDGMATKHLETETETDRDATAIRKRAKEEWEGKILNGEEAEKVYRGAANYKTYLDHREQTGLAKGSGIRAGPVRQNTVARAITRIDYQPDVCKDYKETGYCGYGDSCKFMHDRGDYKNSVELDKEWEAEQKTKKLLEMQLERESNPLQDVPFACSICRKPFQDAVKTKCGHYFCELCALKDGRKFCPVCQESTDGIFKPAPPEMKLKFKKAAELYYKEDEGEKNEEVNENE